MKYWLELAYKYFSPEALIAHWKSLGTP